MHQYENVIYSETLEEVGEAGLEVDRLVAEDQEAGEVAEDAEASDHWDSNTL